jgi:hypothetical protein
LSRIVVDGVVGLASFCIQQSTSSLYSRAQGAALSVFNDKDSVNFFTNDGRVFNFQKWLCRLAVFDLPNAIQGNKFFQIQYMVAAT